MGWILGRTDGVLAARNLDELLDIADFLRLGAEKP